MSVINIRVLSFKFLVDRWDVFVYGRGWPHASQVCCDIIIYVTIFLAVNFPSNLEMQTSQSPSLIFLAVSYTTDSDQISNFLSIHSLDDRNQDD